MAEIKAGDVVQLKSGSPKMTVERVEQSEVPPYAVCSWFDSKGQPQSGTYNLSSLVISNESSFGGFPGR